MYYQSISVRYVIISNEMQIFREFMHDNDEEADSPCLLLYFKLQWHRLIIEQKYHLVTLLYLQVIFTSR